MSTTEKPLADAGRTGMPDDIERAVEALEDAAIEYSREAAEGISGNALHRARLAWDDAKVALRLAISAHLPAGREALSREKE